MARQDRSSRLNKKKMATAAMTLFKDADEDGNGVLDAVEVRQIFRALASDLGLQSRTQVVDITNAVMKEADLSGDGLLNYEEFLPVALEIIESVFHKYRGEKNGCVTSSSEKKNADTATPRSVVAEVLDARCRLRAKRMKAEGVLVNGMSKQDIAELTKDIFRGIDTNGNGVVEPSELRASLVKGGSGLSLSSELVEGIMQTLKTDKDGNVSYSDFAPLCYEFLVEELAQNYVLEEDDIKSSVIYRKRAERLLRDMGEKEVEARLLNMFRAADADSNGAIDSGELILAIEKMELGFTTTDIGRVLESVGGVRAKLEYAEFAPLAYGLLTEQIQNRIKDDDDVREEAMERIYGTIPQDQVVKMFEAVFDAADTNKDGTLSKEEMARCLRSSQIEFSDEDIRRITNISDLNGDGKIQLDEFMPVCYELTLEVAMSQVIAEREGR
eukprot:g1269.t1